MPFPLANATEMQDLLSIFQFINNRATEGLFFPIILLAIWMVAFIGSIAEGRPASRAWIFASFIGAVLGSLLSILGMLNVTYVYFLILNIAFAIAWIKLEGAKLN
tara:strand:- start:689 stop:1003 length:315 start_codon:yes stop_codon:yes gene_type:complete